MRYPIDRIRGPQLCFFLWKEQYTCNLILQARHAPIKIERLDDPVMCLITQKSSSDVVCTRPSSDWHLHSDLFECVEWGHTQISACRIPG